MVGSLKSRQLLAALAFLLVLLPLPAGAGGGGGTVGIGVSPVNKYKVFAFNDLGMHCYDGDFSVFSLLPLFNTVHAQVVMRQFPKPVVLNSSVANLYYAAIKDPSNSINRTSAGKTNFWSYLYLLFGVSQPVDTGLLGARMPGLANVPQLMGAYDANCKWFSATGIPLTNIDDFGQTNYFPMMRITASDKTGSVLSNLDIVVPASSEMNCVSCHETAAFADYVTTFSDASPPPRIGPPPGANLLQDTDFSNNPDPKVRFRENVLILHDALGSYGGLNPQYPGYIAAAYPNHNSLWEVYQAGQPILCAKCHYSKALDLAGSGPDALQADHLYLSRAMHKHHGTDWPMMDGSYVIPIPGAYTTPATPSSCYYCHPGNDTQCLRSVMAVKGMSCQNCHGDLLAVGGFTSQLATDGFVDPYLPNVSDPSLAVNLTTTGAQRRPWQDLPKCQSCHSGDALNHLGASIVGQMAHDPNDDAATPLIATNQRFAENPGQLFRFSSTHGGMACESCHGSPHAEWPSRNNSNDNITPTELQGYAGPIFECGVCHQPAVSLNLNGPHGLHSVNDRRWYGTMIHWVVYQQNPAACQACHGLDLKGTVLSRTATNRNLVKMGNTRISYNAGTPVSCFDCHANIIPASAKAR